MTLANSLPAFHVMAKPTGSKCNLDCAYCFYLKKEQMYPDSSFRMSDEVMEQYIRQTIEGHRIPNVTIAWQGGEPTLMGLDFFRRAMDVEKKYAKPGMQIENTFQTNGVLLDEEWCRFFHENNFLIGLSVDGPRHLHDAYRYDKGGAGTFDKVVRAARLMQEHKVEFNVLCTVNSVNSVQPIGSLPLFPRRARRALSPVHSDRRAREQHRASGRHAHHRPLCPPGAMGQVPDRDLRRVGAPRCRHHVCPVLRRGAGIVRARLFDRLRFAADLRAGRRARTQRRSLLLRSFVEPKHWLGNIQDSPIETLVSSEKQRAFGQDKSSSLPQYCRKCEFLFTCHGECPKNRVLTTPDGEPGLNWLCSGLKAFYAHTERPMRIMAELLKRGRYADEIMPMLAAEEATKLKKAFASSGRNDPCPCGSGRKFKRCHGGGSAERGETRFEGRVTAAQ